VFEKFMQYLPGLAWIKDLEGRYVYVNDAAAHAFGHSREEMYGRTDLQIFPLATANQFRENDRKALESEGGVEVIEVLEQKGRLHHSLVSKFTIPGADGRPAFVGGVAIDITKHREAEFALRASEERLRLATDTGKVGIWEWDISRNKISWTDSLFQIHGLARDEFKGTIEAFTELIHPDDRAMVAQALTQSLEADAPYEVEFRTVRPDGEPVWLFTNAVTLRENGTPVRMIGASVDITWKKRAEEELREADRRKDEFLATLAHELRNPLAPLRNGLEIMRLAQGDPAAMEEAREMMDRQLGQLVRLVDDLLDVSRISRGKLTLRLERAELGAIVRNAVETARHHLESNGHELSLDLPPGPIWLSADATRLAQVFSNLLHNASKYSDAGSEIRLAVTRRGTTAEIAVSDEGIGIPPAMLTKVFELFAQVDHSLEKAHGGLGIGLTIVQQLVEMHGGTVRAESEGLHKGSRFVVSLPISAPPEKKAARTRTVPEPSPDALRVLVVDDNADAARTLGMMLKIKGCHSKCVHDGEEALAAAEEWIPHVILLDIGMPKMNGYDVCRKLRETAWGSVMTVVALTGWGQEEDRRKSVEAGFDHHLVKPLEWDLLHEILDQARLKL
jgi:PAS domain S-box-containing protein